MKRYDMQSVHNGDFWDRELRVTANGDWVKFTDYADLEAELTQLRSEQRKTPESHDEDGHNVINGGILCI